MDDHAAQRDWESMFNKLNVASGGMDGRLDALERQVRLGAPSPPHHHPGTTHQPTNISPQAGSVVDLLNTKADKASVDLLAAQVASLRAELANMRAELRSARGGGGAVESWSDGF